jgi:hypothetical protein
MLILLEAALPLSFPNDLRSLASLSHSHLVAELVIVHLVLTMGLAGAAQPASK